MSEGASGAEQCVLDAFREQMCMQNFAFEPTDGSSHILQALILQDVETIKESVINCTYSANSVPQFTEKCVLLADARTILAL